MNGQENNPKYSPGFAIITIRLEDFILVDDILVMFKERKGNQIKLAIRAPKSKKITRLKREHFDIAEARVLQEKLVSLVHPKS